MRPLPETPLLPASFWWFSVITTVVPTIVLFIVMYLMKSLHIGDWIWPVQSTLIGLAMVLVWWRYRRDLAQMRAMLAAHDRMICPRCHYPIDRAAPAERCPECGTDSDPTRVAAVWDRWEKSLDEKKRKPRTSE